MKPDSFHSATLAKIREPRRIEVAGARWVVAVLYQTASPLRVADDLQAIGYRPYCPLLTGMHRHTTRATDGRWRRKVTQKPLFGCYLFVGEVDAPLYRSTHAKIMTVLGDGLGSTSAISPAFLERLNAEDLAGTWDLRPRKRGPRFRPAQVVRVKTGPFADFLGVVSRAEAKARIRIDIDVFSRWTEVVVAEDDLEVA